jgi:hypothetical protein
MKKLKKARPPLGAGRAQFIPNVSVPNQQRPAMRLYLYLVLLTLLTACSKRAQVVGIGDDDPEMAAAIAQARQTLPQFWQVFDKREHGESNFVLVVRITEKDVSNIFSRLTSSSATARPWSP